MIGWGLNNGIKYSVRDEGKWIEVREGLEIWERMYEGKGWEKGRGIVMVREEIDKGGKGGGKEIKEVEVLEDEEDLGK